MPTKSIKSLHALCRFVITIVFLIVSGTVFSNESAPVKQLRIAVASNFLETSQLLAKAFKQSSGVSVKISSGSSGKLYHQIMHGAPFDIFLSADKEKPAQLIDNHKAVATSRLTYAKGQLVLWLKKCEGKDTLGSLISPSYLKIAIANPKLAPYGASTKALLENNDLWDTLGGKLVLPENIAQVAQLAKLRVVDAAFIAKAHARNLQTDNKNNPPSCLVELSSDSYPSIEQQLVLVKASRNQEVAQRFIEYLQSKSAQALIKSMGYLVN